MGSNDPIPSGGCGLSGGLPLCENWGEKFGCPHKCMNMVGWKGICDFYYSYNKGLMLTVLDLRAGCPEVTCEGFHPEVTRGSKVHSIYVRVVAYAAAACCCC